MIREEKALAGECPVLQTIFSLPHCAGSELQPPGDWCVWGHMNCCTALEMNCLNPAWK